MSLPKSDLAALKKKIQKKNINPSKGIQNLIAYIYLIIIFANWAIFKNAYFVKMCPKAGKEDLTKE